MAANLKRTADYKLPGEDAVDEETIKGRRLIEDEISKARKQITNALCVLLGKNNNHRSVEEFTAALGVKQDTMKSDEIRDFLMEQKAAMIAEQKDDPEADPQNRQWAQPRVRGDIPDSIPLAGARAGWQKITLTRPDEHPVSAQYPDVILLASGKVVAIGTPDDPPRLPKKEVLDAEGYHLFRLEPRDANKNGDTHDYDVQIRRDRQLLGDIINTTKVAGKKSKAKKPRLIFAPVNTQVDRSLNTSGATCSGGILFTPTVPEFGKSLVNCGIYIFKKQDHLPKDIAERLMVQQISNRKRNTAALAGVAFIAGQLYRNPDLSWTEKLIKAVNIKMGYKVGLAGVGALAVFLFSLTPVGIPAILAMVAVTVGIKSIIKRKFIKNPAKLLKDRNFTAFMRNDVTDAEAAEIRKYLSKGDNGNDGQVAPEDSGKKKFEDYVARSDGDIGDLLRRSFVHLRYAEDALDGYDTKTREKQHKAIGTAFHHIEKTWRYMSGSLIFYGMALETNRVAKLAWRKKSPAASKRLIQHFQKIYDDNEALQTRATARPIMVKTVSLSFKKSVSYQFGKLGQFMHLKSTERSARDDREQQIEAYLTHAYPEVIAKGHTQQWAESAHDIGGPELFAEWQTRGGMLEPYDPFDGMQRSDAEKASRTGKTVALIERLQNQGLAQLSDGLYDRLKLYHGIMNVLSDAGDIPGNASEFTQTLAQGLRSHAQIKDAWKKADKISDGSIFSLSAWTRVKHDYRNIWRKATRGEIITDAAFSVFELAAGMWGQLGFGALGNAIGIKSHNSHSINLEMAGKKAGLSFGLAITQIGALEATKGMTKGNRSYNTDNANLLGQNARGTTINRQTAENAVMPDPQVVANTVAEAVGDDNPLDDKKLNEPELWISQERIVFFKRHFWFLIF